MIQFQLAKAFTNSLSIAVCAVLVLAVGATSASAQAEVDDISFDDLTFEMEKEEVFDREMLTEEIFDLHDTEIRLRGFIRPTTRQRGLTKFIFVRDNKECCFGPQAALFDCVLVKLAEGESTEFTVRPVTIRGRFFISEFTGPDDRVWAIYRMKNCVVE